MLEVTQRKSAMTPVSWVEHALLLSAIPATLIGLLVFSWPAVEAKARDAIAGVLEKLCSAGIPTFWCRVQHDRITYITVVQMFDYLVFILVSAGYLAWVFSGKYKKPANYIAGEATSAPLWARVVWFITWGVAVVGGQMLPAKISPLSYAGLLYTIAFFWVGLYSLRALAISVRFTRNQGDSRV